MSSRSPHGSRRGFAAGSFLALLAASAATVVAVAVPSGASAAAETEYAEGFSASCVLGTGSLNIETSLAIAAKASGPVSLQTAGTLTFAEGTITLTAPVETTEAFVALGASEVRGALKQLPATVTNATPASLNLIESAGSGGIPFEGTVERGKPLILRLSSGGPKLSWGPFSVIGSLGQDVTLTASAAPGFQESEIGYKATGEGIVATLSAYNGEGAKLIGPLALDCTAPANTVFAVVPISTQRTETCTTTTHTPFPAGYIEPHEGPSAGGTPVTINPGAPGYPTAVEFAGADVPFTDSSGHISANSPPGTGTVYVHVTVPCYGREFVGDFTYISSITAHGPEVTGIEPDSGPEKGGTTVTLTGHNFIGTESVLFGKQPATSFKVNSASSITAVSPPGSGHVIVRAVGYGVDEEHEVGFFYARLVPPRVNWVEPEQGPPSGGTRVTISGTGFEEVKDVVFGSKAATSFTVNSPTSITATTPSGSGTVAVSVTAAGGTSETYLFDDEFSYGPSVNSLAPDRGPGGGGTKVTIDGTNFYEIKSVTFGSKAATSFTVNSPTSITATAPAGTGSVEVSVTGAGGTGYGYYHYAPVIAAIAPTHGPVGGGTPVTITGTNFREVTRVAFGSQKATSFTVESPTSITAIAPPGSGRALVTVTSTGGTSEETPEDEYLYVLPGPRVSAWGANEHGQLGDGLTETSSAECEEPCSSLPVEVIDLGEVNAVATSSTSRASLALLKSGSVVAWGSGYLGNGDTLLPEQCFLSLCSTYPLRVSGLSEVTAVATDGEDSLALLRSGKVMAWGSNLQGQLGNGRAGSEGEVVADVPTAVSGLSEVSAVAVGAHHDLALLKNGTVMAWGDNSDGELGDGTTTDRDSPVKVTGLSEVTAVAAGYNFSLALKRDGTVMAWGNNKNGELGDGTSTGPDSCGPEDPCSTTPVPVTGLSQVRSVSAGVEDGLADLSNGTVMAWGGSVPDVVGIYGELGESTTPVAVLGLSEAIAVAAGDDGGLALNASGTVMAWGDDSSGEIGNRTVSYRFSPIERVDSLGHVVSIAAGEYFDLAVVTETEPVSFKNWTLAGTITPKPLGQAIALPSGSTFNGSGELNTETGAGTLSGNISVPPFKAAVKLYGFVPVSLGMTVTQSGAIAGTIAKSTTVSGDETLTLPVQLKLGFTSLGLLGLNVPTSCSTAQPVSLTLTDTLSKEALLSKGWAFSGTTTIPKITCTGGLLGALYGEVINGLVAGAGSSYSLTVSAPGG